MGSPKNWRFTMCIVRTIHNVENPFVQINRQALRDPNLSLEAVGLWARLLSRPDNWSVSVAELTQSCGCGKDRIYRILNELVKNGYAYRFQKKKEDGRFKSFDTYVFECKTNEEEIKKMFTQRDFPEAAEPLAENTDTKNKEREDSYSSNSYISKKKEKGKDPTPPLFLYKRVKMPQERYDSLIKDFGEKKIKEMMERLDEYADINPKRFKEYGCHSAVIRKWIREDNEKNPKFQPNAEEQENVILNRKAAKDLQEIYREIQIGEKYVKDGDCDTKEFPLNMPHGNFKDALYNHFKNKYHHEFEDVCK